MRAFASPRRGRCASCEGELTGMPVYRMDETYCCRECAYGGPCMCTYESDLAEDGVDGLGLPFALPAMDDAVPQPASETVARRYLFRVTARTS
jgi:hypothetical protein